MDGCIRFACLGLCLLVATAPTLAVEPKSAALSPVQSPVRVATLAFIEPDGTRLPVVEVWSNGFVQAVEQGGTRDNPAQITRKDQLTAAEMRELYRLLAGECRIPSLSSASIRQSLQAASQEQQLTSEITGAAETEVGLLVGKHWHAVTCPAVSILTTRFPDVAEVQNVATAQARLQNIAAVALLGGSEVADRQAVAATRKLRELHPEAGVITRRDLKMVRQLPNGNRFVQFHYAGSPGQGNACLVSLTQSPMGPTRMSVLDSPTIVR